MALTSSCIHCWTPVSIKKIRDDPWAEWQTYNHTEFMKTWDKGYNFEEKKFKARMQAIKLKYPDKSSRLLPLCCENKLKPLTSLPFQSAKPVPMQPPFGCPSALSASVRLLISISHLWVWFRGDLRRAERRRAVSLRAWRRYSCRREGGQRATEQATIPSLLPPLLCQHPSENLPHRRSIVSLQPLALLSMCGI